MTKRRLKKSVIPVLYATIALVFIGTIFMIETTISNNQFKEDEDYDYVSETIFDKETPVVNTDVLLAKPYTDTELKILKNFYDYKESAENQQNAIIYHENTYLQNTGVVYGGKDNFDVVAILDGQVTEVKQDNLLGNIVEVKHDNDIISIYQSLGEVAVKKGDVVKQGQILGKSGTSNIEPNLGSHLLFELIIKGQTVNPENYYEKKVNEI